MSEEKLPDHKPLCSRRQFLGFGMMASGVLAMPALIRPAFAGMGAYRVAFRNAHTGESFSGVYRVGDKYLPEAFDQINYIMRDFRTGDTQPMDPKLIDLMYWMQYESESGQPFEVISGYRSPKTNAMLRQASTGVARNSLHMKGKAVDLRVPHYSTAQLRRVAVNLKAGGVGYYAKSNFLHVDTGRVRQW